MASSVLSLLARDPGHTPPRRTREFEEFWIKLRAFRVSMTTPFCYLPSRTWFSPPKLKLKGLISKSVPISSVMSATRKNDLECALFCRISKRVVSLHDVLHCETMGYQPLGVAVLVVDSADSSVVHCYSSKTS